MMNMNEAREIKLRQMRAKRHRVVRLQKTILSVSLAAMVCFAGGMHLLLNQNSASFIAKHTNNNNSKSATSSFQILGNAHTELQKAASVALENSGMKTIAHRGFSSAAPENSLAAFELAAQSGTWGIETDVWRTSDGEFVCMHDGSMDRMTNIGGSIAGLTSTQISGAVIDHGSGIANYPNEKVPTLREYLELCSQYGINAVLDIKFADASFLEDMISIVRECNMEGASIALTNLDLMKRIRELSSTMQVQYLVNEATKEAIDAAASIERSGIAASSITPELIDYAQEKGLMINVWTYNSPEDKARWKELNVDYLTTDTVA